MEFSVFQKSARHTVRQARLMYGLALILFAVFMLVIPFTVKGYNLLVVNLILIYIIVSIGYNFVLGYTGQLSLAQAAFFGMGAYSCAIMMTKLGVSFWFAMPLAGFVTAIAGILIGIPSLKLSGIYLAMLTFSFAEFILWVFTHLSKVTGGVYGLAIISPSLGPIDFSTDLSVYYLVLIFCVLMVVFSRNIVNSKIGRAFGALRDSEEAAKAMGIDVVRYKIMAFALSAFYAGIAGAFFDVVILYVHPKSFGLFELIRQLTMIVIGGLGSIVGSILGAIIMVIVPELLREFKALQTAIYGVALIVFVIFMPGGIVGLFKLLRSRLLRIKGRRQQRVMS